MLEEYHIFQAAAEKENSDLETKRNEVAMAEERVDAKQASLDKAIRQFEVQQDTFDAEGRKEREQPRIAHQRAIVSTLCIPSCCFSKDRHLHGRRLQWNPRRRTRWLTPPFSWVVFSTYSD